MDADRFDRLVRSLTTRSRRGFSRALAGLGLAGGVGTLLRTADSEAKKRKKKKCKGKKKCGKKCIAKSACCTDADCAESESCCAGQCFAPIHCGDEKTCGCDEYCRLGGGNYSCHHGACPNVNFCNDVGGFYYCGVCDWDACCLCATSIDGTSGCVDFDDFVPQTCASNDDCTEVLGQPALCLPGGPGVGCNGANTVCAPRCTGGLPRRAAGQSGRSRASTLKPGN
jgi:hypothetical protein